MCAFLIIWVAFRFGTFLFMQAKIKKKHEMDGRFVCSTNFKSINQMHWNMRNNGIAIAFGVLECRGNIIQTISHSANSLRTYTLFMSMITAFYSLSISLPVYHFDSLLLTLKALTPVTTTINKYQSKQSIDNFFLLLLIWCVPNFMI